MQVKRTKKLNALIALEIILTMTLYYFIFVGDAIITYAADLIESLNPEIEMDAYFVDQNGNKLKEIEAAVNEENLNLYVDIAVKSEGCFNGAIYLNNSNFEIAKETVDENIVSVDGNKVNLKQIDGKSDVTINLKISPIKADSYKLENLNKETEVALEGIYKISDSKKSEFSRAKNVKLTIKNPYEEQDDNLILNANIITNGTFKVGDDVKKIVQVYLTSNLKDNIYPVKNNKISIKLPENVQNVEVLSRGTEATNGKTEKEFESSNWNFDKTSSILTINVENKEIDGAINWKDNSLDKFIVNLTFDEKEDLSNANIIIKGQADLWNQKSTSIKTIELTDFTKNAEEIIKADINIQNEKIYKGYLYTKEETEFSSNSTIDIRYSNISSNIKYTENISKYICANDTLDANGGYTKSKVNKADLFKVIGQKGEISITNEEGKILKDINWNTEADENGDIVIDLAKEKKLNIEIKNAENTGTITFKNTLMVQEEKYTKDQLKDVKKIEISGTVEAKEINNIHDAKGNKDLTESASGAKITANVRQFTTSEINKNIDIKTTLYTNSAKFNLFKNPKVKITFPKDVKNVDINKISLWNEEELKAGTYKKITENECIVLYVDLVGEQTKHVGSSIIKGASIIINCDIMCDKDTTDTIGELNMEFTNEGEDNYYYAAKSTLKVKYVIPEPVVTEETRETTEEPVKTTDDKAQNENVNAEQKESISITKQLNTGDNTEILERQVYEYVITVKNNGTTNLKNITVVDTIPEELNYVTEILDQGYQNDFVEDAKTRETSKEIENLEAGESTSFSYKVLVNKNDANIGKTIGTKATITIGEKVYESNLPQNTIKENDLQFWLLTGSSRTFYYDDMSTIEYFAKIKNCSENDMSSIKIKDYVPEELEYISSCYVTKEDEWYSEEEVVGEYDEASRCTSWDVGTLPANEEIGVMITLSTKKMEVDSETIDISNQFEATVDGKEIKSNSVEITQRNRIRVGVQLASNLQDTYITENQEFEYIITVINYDKNSIASVKLEDNLPKGLIGKEISWKQEGSETSYQVGDKVWLNAEIPADDSVKFTIKVRADELEDGVDSLEIRNKASVSGINFDNAESNELVNIIRRDPNKDDDSKDNNDNNNDNKGDDNKEDNNNNNNNNQNGGNNNQGNNNQGNNNQGENNLSNKISGVAWLDQNGNGQRDSGEEYIKNVKVNLLYAENGQYVKDKNGNNLEQTTNNNGEYTFSELESNRYMVIFEYDNSKYDLTEYQKNGVNSDLNSDATLYELSDNNNVGITNTIEINNSNAENIDIGLMERKVFDLKLDKYIDKITVKNNTETKNYELNNSKLAKVELKSKYVDSTEIEIQYKIVVTNEGQTTGYAKQIIDYIPDGYNFDSKLNDGWQIVKGDLLYQGLKDTKIEPGSSKTISLRLTKKLSKASLGMITNTAEIYEDYNSYGIDDKDSTPNNKNSSEDDLSSASAIISISTGRIIKYSVIAILSLAIITIGVFIIKKEVIDKG